MFLKELEAVLIPWWLLVLLLTGDQGIWHWPLYMVALYIVLTEIRYRWAVRESRAYGFMRMVRMPVATGFLRILLWRRITIQGGGKCYTLHVHGRPKSDREFLRELKSDIEVGTRESAVYVGNTFYDLGEFAARQLGHDKVTIMTGTLFGRWLQTWKVPDQPWRIVKIEMRGSQ